MADILLSLSYGETFGMTIAEANACGVPAIVYNNTAQPELVSSETGRLVSTGNVEELADMVIKYSKELQNNKYREFVSSSCTTRVSNNFSSRNCCVKYVDMYETVGKTK